MRKQVSEISLFDMFRGNRYDAQPANVHEEVVRSASTAERQIARPAKRCVELTRPTLSV